MRLLKKLFSILLFGSLLMVLAPPAARSGSEPPLNETLVREYKSDLEIAARERGNNWLKVLNSWIHRDDPESKEAAKQFLRESLSRVNANQLPVTEEMIYQNQNWLTVFFQPKDLPRDERIKRREDQLYLLTTFLKGLELSPLQGDNSILLPGSSSRNPLIEFSKTFARTLPAEGSQSLEPRISTSARLMLFALSRNLRNEINGDTYLKERHNSVWVTSEEFFQKILTRSTLIEIFKDKSVAETFLSRQQILDGEGLYNLLLNLIEAYIGGDSGAVPSNRRRALEIWTLFYGSEGWRDLHIAPPTVAEDNQLALPPPTTLPGAPLSPMRSATNSADKTLLPKVNFEFIDRLRAEALSRIDEIVKADPSLANEESFQRLFRSCRRTKDSYLLASVKNPYIEIEQRFVEASQNYSIPSAIFVEEMNQARAVSIKIEKLLSNLSKGQAISELSDDLEQLAVALNVKDPKESLRLFEDFARNLATMKTVARLPELLDSLANQLGTRQAVEFSEYLKVHSSSADVRQASFQTALRESLAEYRTHQLERREAGTHRIFTWPNEAESINLIIQRLSEDPVTRWALVKYVIDEADLPLESQLILMGTYHKANWERTRTNQNLLDPQDLNRPIVFTQEKIQDILTSGKALELNKSITDKAVLEKVAWMLMDLYVDAPSAKENSLDKTVLLQPQIQRFLILSQFYLSKDWHLALPNVHRDVLAELTSLVMNHQGLWGDAALQTQLAAIRADLKEAGNTDALLSLQGLQTAVREAYIDKYKQAPQLESKFFENMLVEKGLRYLEDIDEAHVGDPTLALAIQNYLSIWKANNTRDKTEGKPLELHRYKKVIDGLHISQDSNAGLSIDEIIRIDLAKYIINRMAPYQNKKLKVEIITLFGHLVRPTLLVKVRELERADKVIEFARDTRVRSDLKHYFKTLISHQDALTLLEHPEDEVIKALPMEERKELAINLLALFDDTPADHFYALLAFHKSGWELGSGDLETSTLAQIQKLFSTAGENREAFYVALRNARNQVSGKDRTIVATSYNEILKQAVSATDLGVEAYKKVLQNDLSTHLLTALTNMVHYQECVTTNCRTALKDVLAGVVDKLNPTEQLEVTHISGLLDHVDQLTKWHTDDGLKIDFELQLRLVSLFVKVMPQDLPLEKRLLLLSYFCGSLQALSQEKSKAELLGNFSQAFETQLLSKFFHQNGLNLFLENDEVQSQFVKIIPDERIRTLVFQKLVTHIKPTLEQWFKVVDSPIWSDQDRDLAAEGIKKMAQVERSIDLGLKPDGDIQGADNALTRLVLKIKEARQANASSRLYDLLWQISGEERDDSRTMQPVLYFEKLLQAAPSFFVAVADVYSTKPAHPDAQDANFQIALVRVLETSLAKAQLPLGLNDRGAVSHILEIAEKIVPAIKPRLILVGNLLGQVALLSKANLTLAEKLRFISYLTERPEEAVSDAESEQFKLREEESIQLISSADAADFFKPNFAHKLEQIIPNEERRSAVFVRVAAHAPQDLNVWLTIQNSREWASLPTSQSVARAKIVELARANSEELISAIDSIQAQSGKLTPDELSTLSRLGDLLWQASGDQATTPADSERPSLPPLYYQTHLRSRPFFAYLARALGSKLHSDASFRTALTRELEARSNAEQDQQNMELGDSDALIISEGIGKLLPNGPNESRVQLVHLTLGHGKDLPWTIRLNLLSYCADLKGVSVKGQAWCQSHLTSQLSQLSDRDLRAQFPLGEDVVFVKNGTGKRRGFVFASILKDKSNTQKWELLTHVLQSREQAQHEDASLRPLVLAELTALLKTSPQGVIATRRLAGRIDDAGLKSELLGVIRESTSRTEYYKTIFDRYGIWSTVKFAVKNGFSGNDDFQSLLTVYLNEWLKAPPSKAHPINLNQRTFDLVDQMVDQNKLLLVRYIYQVLQTQLPSDQLDSAKLKLMEMFGHYQKNLIERPLRDAVRKSEAIDSGQNPFVAIMSGEDVLHLSRIGEGSDESGRQTFLSQIGDFSIHDYNTLGRNVITRSAQASLFDKAQEFTNLCRYYGSQAWRQKAESFYGELIAEITTVIKSDPEIWRKVEAQWQSLKAESMSHFREERYKEIEDFADNVYLAEGKDEQKIEQIYAKQMLADADLGQYLLTHESFKARPSFERALLHTLSLKLQPATAMKSPSLARFSSIQQIAGAYFKHFRAREKRPQNSVELDRIVSTQRTLMQWLYSQAQGNADLAKRTVILLLGEASPGVIESGLFNSSSGLALSADELKSLVSERGALSCGINESDCPYRVAELAKNAVEVYCKPYQGREADYKKARFEILSRLALSQTWDRNIQGLSSYLKGELRTLIEPVNPDKAKEAAFRSAVQSILDVVNTEVASMPHNQHESRRLGEIEDAAVARNCHALFINN